ncbi:hypothetical protein SAG0135_03090 [Streptococcus agalactiae LMG 14609]|nr:hypothetical protein SAG0135_03090 [Streptococcus agalactiae LMG 14609]
MGQTLSKKEILDYIARNLNSSVGGESKNVQYSNIEFKESAYLKRQLDDGKTEEIAIDNDAKSKLINKRMGYFMIKQDRKHLKVFYSKYEKNS